MRIYAHRGASASFPENTLAAFRRAVELGVEGIELDVQLSSDLVPVVIHDATADRTTNGTGNIGEFTARQLSLLDAGEGEFVPTLAQVLELAAGNLRVNIELKDASSAGPVAQAVEIIPGLDWFASSADWNALVELRVRIPDAKIYPLCVADFEKIKANLPEGMQEEEFSARTLAAGLEFALAHQAEGLSIWEAGLEQEDFDLIHKSDLQAWVWTVNDPERARELMALGADGICTDDPELVLSVTAAAPEAPQPAATAMTGR